MLLRPKRNLEVLSISALDLFASALGVFILISVLLFPYYLKQPSLDAALAGAESALEAAGTDLDAARLFATDLADAQAAAEARRQRAVDKLQEAEASREEMTQALAQAASRAQETLQKQGALQDDLATFFIGDLDLVFVMDATGSMRDEIEDVQANLLGIVRILHKLAPTLSVGFVAFKDRDAEYITRAFPLSPMEGRNLTRIQSFVEQLTAFGGDDYPEPVDRAVSEAVAMPWRHDVIGRIVLVGDAPAHEQNWSRTFEMAAGFHRGAPAGADRRVSAIFTGSRNEGRDFYRRLAEAGGGDFVAHRGQMMESVLLSVLDSSGAAARAK